MAYTDLHIITARVQSRRRQHQIHRAAAEGPAKEEEVIVVEHEPEPSVEVTPSKIDQGKHHSIYLLISNN